MLKSPGPFPVYVLRHGETQFNVEKRLQGSGHDSPLTKRGQQQARQVGSILKGILDAGAPPRFMSSPLPRARKTLEIILETLELPPFGYPTDPRLVEIDLGEWSGQRAAEVQRKDGARWDARAQDKWNVPVPGGESYAAVAERAGRWFRELTEPTVAVSHGGFTRVLRGIYLGLTWQEISALDEPHGAVFRFQDGEVTRIEAHP